MSRQAILAFLIIFGMACEAMVQLRAYPLVISVESDIDFPWHFSTFTACTGYFEVESKTFFLVFMFMLVVVLEVLVVEEFVPIVELEVMDPEGLTEEV